MGVQAATAGDRRNQMEGLVIDHPEESLYVGVHGLAERLGCSPSAIRAWEEQGRIPRAGRVAGTGRRVWRLSDVDAFAGEQAARRRDRRQKTIAR